MHKIPISAAHDKSTLEPFIFFAERIRELLAHSVDDSYKVSVLNSRTRALELERLLRHSYDTTQRASSLTPLLEEFESSLRSDPVVRELHSKDTLLSMSSELAAAFTSDKPRLLIEAADTLKAINIMLSPYYVTAEALLRRKIAKTGEKKLISKLCEIIIIEIQSKGYSREHIRHISKTKLASKLSRPAPFNINDALTDFFSSFSGKFKSFTCATRCRGDFDESAAKVLKVQLSPNLEGFRKANLLDLGTDGGNERRQDDYNLYVIMREVKAFDVFEAREKLYGTLHFQNATQQFLLHRPRLFYSEFCLVQDEETKQEIRIRKPLNAMLIGQKHESEEALSNKRSQLIIAFSKFTEKSKRSFVSAIKYHKEALDSLSTANQLVDLWAALEGFVPQPIDSSPRMASVLSHVLPAQTLKYAEKKFSYVAEGIRLAGQTAIDIVNSIEVEGTFSRKVVALILCEEFDQQVKDLMALLTHSPLLRFRIYSLFENFSTMESTRTELLRHRKRLEWQLRRIYISRNTVMHSATAYGDTDLLVENLHSYLDNLINATIAVAWQSPNKTSINSVLKLLGAYETSYLDSLANNPQKQKRLNKENFGTVLFDCCNPLLKQVGLHAPDAEGTHS
ncbi:MAG TPA: hypothetical protein VGE12_00790 [Noviherbaspirillum sp.]